MFIVAFKTRISDMNWHETFRRELVISIMAKTAYSEERLVILILTRDSEKRISNSNYGKKTR